MKKLFSLALVLVMLLGTVPFASADEEVTLVFMNLASYSKEMNLLAERYYEETGVKVIVEDYAFGDLINTIEVKIGTGSKDYDILSLDVPLISSYARRGMLADLSPYFAEEDTAKFLPAAVDASTYEGKLYAAPLNTSSMVLYFNTKLLTEAGVDLTELENSTAENRITWERLAEITEEALKVLDPDGSKGILGMDFSQVTKVYQMNQLPNSMGGVQVDETGLSLEGVLNSEPYIKALNWYQDQVEKGVCSRGISSSEIASYFYSGKMLFFIAGTEAPKNCENNGMTDLGIAYCPAFEGYEDKVATPTGSWHYGVNGNSQNVEEAAKFVKWLTCTDEITEQFYSMRNNFTAYIPLLNKIAADENTGEQMKIAIWEAQNTAYPRALTPAYNEYSAILDAVWSDVRNGEDVEETIEWAIEEFASQTIKYNK